MPTVLHVMSPDFMAVGTESGEVQFFDLRSSLRPVSSVTAHPDYISSLATLPGEHRPQLISTGESTLSITDIRNGMIDSSEDQQDELLSCAFLPGRKSRAVVGTALGCLTFFDVGFWGHGVTQFTLTKESIDAMQVLEDKLLVAGGDGVQLVDPNKGRTINKWYREEEVACIAARDQWIFAGVGDSLRMWNSQASEASASTNAKRKKQSKHKRADVPETFFSGLG